MQFFIHLYPRFCGMTGTAQFAAEEFREFYGKNVVVIPTNRAEITRNGIDMEAEGLKGPSSTWTYLVNDDPEQFKISPVSRDPAAAAVNAPLFLIVAMYNRFCRKKSGL